MKAEVAKNQATLLYSLIGRYGSKLPRDVLDEMRTEAEVYQKRSERILKSIKI